MSQSKDDKYPLNTVATAEIDGEVIRASHTPETYKLIKEAREELKNWLPQWGAKPKPDPAAVDAALALREKNDELTKIYTAANRFTDEKSRVGNLMHVRKFCEKLHNILGLAADGGSRVFINDPPYHPAIDSHMKGLFIKIRGMDNFIYHTDLPPGWKKICGIQVPYMSEWGIMNLDGRGCFRSWKYIGWRGNVLLRLILAGAISEEEAHREFGVPQGNDIDREYYLKLEEYRRGKRAN